MNLFYEDKNAAKKRMYSFAVDGERNGFEPKFNQNTNGKVSILNDLNKAQNFYLINCYNPKNYTCNRPTTYLWGGKGKITDRKNRIINIHQNEDDVELLANHPGIDCSGLVNLSFLQAGLKITDSMDPIDTPFEINAKQFMSEQKCLNFVQIENKQKIQNGDLVAWDKHIFIVNEATKDPFGINHIESVENCQMTNLDPKKAKLTLINSKGANDPEFNLQTDLVKNSPILTKLIKQTLHLQTGIGPGIVKMKFVEMALSTPYEMMELMQTACLAKFNISLPSRKIKIVRHKLLQNHYSKDDIENCSLGEPEKVSIIGH